MRRSGHTTIAVVLVSLLASGCGSIFGPGDESSALAENRRKWETRGYTSYEYTLRRICFCANTQPMRVTVVNGVVVRAVDTTTHQELRNAYVETIPQLFDFIERSLASHATNFHVAYDPTLGYPREISSDGSAQIADDEVTYTVSEVTPVSGTAPAVTAQRPPPPHAADPLQR